MAIHIDVSIGLSLLYFEDISIGWYLTDFPQILLSCHGKIGFPLVPMYCVYHHNLIGIKGKE